MKTERITVLVSKVFKHFLHTEAAAEGVNVSEFIRRRCELRPGPDEQLLAELAKQLREATKSAESALDAGLEAVQKARATIRKLRAEEGVAV